ncbi:MAG: ATP-binding cassette domain-containing protein, partial [Microbacteriaceae bacterium]|nr:ATP-binding cassette domain-containing protein [Microbacteriaceae bacterium]
SLGIGELSARSVDSLSTGQRRRVNLARVFAQDADVLLLDEPFSGLDEDAKRRVDDCLNWIADLGRTVIVARPR